MAVDHHKFMNFFTDTTTAAAAPATLPSNHNQFYPNYYSPHQTTTTLKIEPSSSSFHYINNFNSNNNDIVYHQLAPAVKDDSGITFNNNHVHHQQVQQLPSRKRSRESVAAPPLLAVNTISTPTSTSGFDCGAKCGGVRNLGFLGGDLSLQIMQQQLDLDRLVSHHMEKMRTEIEEKKKQQLREIMASVEESIATKLRQKEQELSKIGGINYSLQEKIKSLYLENQIWRDLAHTNEETANTLRSNLQQLLQQMNNNNNNAEPTAASDAVSCCGSSGGGGEEEEEGDSHQEWVKRKKVQKDGLENTSSVPVNSNNGNNKSGWIYRGKSGGGDGGRRLLACRKCGEGESSVLILPCRHLCVCTVCGPTVNSCPVCHAVKNASVHVNLS